MQTRATDPLTKTVVALLRSELGQESALVEVELVGNSPYVVILETSSGSPIVRPKPKRFCCHSQVD